MQVRFYFPSLLSVVFFFFFPKLVHTLFLLLGTFLVDRFSAAFVPGYHVTFLFSSPATMLFLLCIPSFTLNSIWRIGLLKCVLSSCLLSPFSSIIKPSLWWKPFIFFLIFFPLLHFLNQTRKKMRWMRLALHSPNFIFTHLYLPAWWWGLPLKLLLRFCCLTWKYTVLEAAKHYHLFRQGLQQLR